MEHAPKKPMFFSFWEGRVFENFLDFDVTNAFPPSLREVVDHMYAHQVPTVV